MAETHSLNASLRSEMRTVLEQMPSLKALCLSFTPWTRIVAEARSEVNDQRLASQLGLVLWHARTEDAGEREQFLFLGPSEVGVVFKVSDDKLLVALAAPTTLDAVSLEALREVAYRLESCFNAWEERLLDGGRALIAGVTGQ